MVTKLIKRTHVSLLWNIEEWQVCCCLGEFSSFSESDVYRSRRWGDYTGRSGPCDSCALWKGRGWEELSGYSTGSLLGPIWKKGRPTRTGYAHFAAIIIMRDVLLTACCIDCVTLTCGLLLMALYTVNELLVLNLTQWPLLNDSPKV